MRDFFIGWHEKFQPLGPALKTPRIEVDEKSAIEEFEKRSFDHPASTGGNAPALSPQDLVPSPAAQVFKVGDRVKAIAYDSVGTITEINRLTGEPFHTVKFDAGDLKWSVFYADCLEHIQPSDTQQWVEWEGGDCPVPQGTRIEVRMREADHCSMRQGRHDFTQPECSAYWRHNGFGNDIVAFRVVQ